MGEYVTEILNRLVLIISAFLLGLCIGKKGE